MTGDLDDLKKAMQAATPSPDPERRAKNLALAQKNFTARQGSRADMRPTSNRPTSGIWKGAFFMWNSITSRAGLTACTALVAVGLVSYSQIGQNTLPEPSIVIGENEATPKEAVQAAPVDQPVAVPTPEDSSVEMVADIASRDSLGNDRLRATQRQMTPTAPRREQVSGGLLLESDAVPHQESDTEAFANANSNPLQITAENPVSTFSIDVDTASYAVVRNSLTNGQLPPADAVRVEEMINYFPYTYPTPTVGEAFRPTVSVTPTPWNADTQLVQIAIQGAVPDADARPPLNLVFLIDTSGSMNAPNKLPLLKQSFRLMLAQLRPEDEVAIVTYAGSAGQVLAPTPARDQQTILAALNNLGAGGSTAGQAGLQQAYATAATMAQDGEVNRVILATDGDFNVGLSDPDALKDFIAGKRDTGTYLSVLGFGRGNLDDATMQALAQNGNGQAAYIDTLSEAQKVLVDQLSGALFPIANDVKIQVEFNPATVAEYRLIGYETRALNREDFNNDKVDAGDIGAGHQVTALYEVTPVGSPAIQNDPLRYSESDELGTSDELGFLKLRYKAPGEAVSQLIETPIRADLPSQPDAGFAMAIAGFGQLLRGSQYLGDWSIADAIALANENKGDDPFGYRAEAIQLMRLAQSLSQ